MQLEGAFISQLHTHTHTHTYNLQSTNQFPRSISGWIIQTFYPGLLAMVIKHDGCIDIGMQPNCQQYTLTHRPCKTTHWHDPPKSVLGWGQVFYAAWASHTLLQWVLILFSWISANWHSARTLMIWFFYRFWGTKYRTPRCVNIIGRFLEYHIPVMYSIVTRFIYMYPGYIGEPRWESCSLITGQPQALLLPHLTTTHMKPSGHLSN